MASSSMGTDRVVLRNRRGAGYVMSKKDADKFLKENPDSGYAIEEAQAEPKAKAVKADDAEDKAVAAPARNRG